MDAKDPDDPTVIDWAPRRAAAIVPFNVVNGRPVNPVRHTGQSGRGDLWLWGENQAADPIVVAEVGGQRLVLLINRDDRGGWAIPGGMVDPGEYAKDALVRELLEETGVDLRRESPQVIAEVYVDDPRNTDEAWICSTVALFRIGHQPRETAGSDAMEAGWFRFGSLAELVADVRARTGGELYAPHPPLLQAALNVLGESR